MCGVPESDADLTQMRDGSGTDYRHGQVTIGGHAPMRLIDLGDVLPDPWRTEPEHDEQDQHELDLAETGWDEVEPDRL